MHDLSRLAAQWVTDFEQGGQFDPTAALEAAQGYAQLVATVELAILLLRRHDTYRTDVATGQGTCRCGRATVLCEINGLLRMVRLTDQSPPWRSA